MRIGVNLLYLIPGIVGGTETYATGLLAAFHRIRSNFEFVLFVNRESTDWVSSRFPSFEKVVCDVHATKRQQRYVFEQLRLPSLLSRLNIDLLHSLGYTSPLRTPCPSVVTIHDLNFKAFGHSMPFARRLALRFFVQQALYRCNKIIAVSEFTRQEICKHYPVCKPKVVVIAEAASFDICDGDEQHLSERLPEQILVSQPYCIAFSSSSPNKNIPNLIRAFQHLRRTESLTHKLVLVGHKFSTTQDDRELDMTDVVQTGYIEHANMLSLLKHADFLVFPSFYEGFGLPVLEAMAVGVPVACSRAGALPEVAGDAALFFDPFSIEDMAAKIRALASSPVLREELRRKGYVNAQRFSWDTAARQTLEVYTELLFHQTNNSLSIE